MKWILLNAETDQVQELYKNVIGVYSGMKLGKVTKRCRIFNVNEYHAPIKWKLKAGKK